ncbi:MarR family winged helix-turn-helix transcriptional regulator [Streptomyces cadmiisoli]|uniref:MarR family winged helix-turn-helix transcriptional regulator n=1 Tax=Streptomyces cadmiisoli TaxID=2184053 RepID=UPI00364D106D
MTTTAPRVDGRVIGLAHHAARAVLETVLARHGVTFHQVVTLRLVAVAGAPVERAALVAEVVGALKTDASEARGVVDGLIAGGLVEAVDAEVRITGAGRELYETSAAETGEIADRIYAGIPAEDLAVAGRVLTLVTERADAELAALAP